MLLADTGVVQACSGKLFDFERQVSKLNNARRGWNSQAIENGPERVHHGWPCGCTGSIGGHLNARIAPEPDVCISPAC